MPDPADVCVLIPTYEEATTIGDVVEGFHAEGYENVLVVDGASSDETRQRAADAGARVEVQSGSGKGQAIREAMGEHVTADYVLMADGDGTYRPGDAERMLAPLDEGYDHVIGNRFADMESGAMTRLNRVGNRLINWLFRRIHGEEFGDILSGYRAFTRESYEALRLTAHGFGIETQLAVECAKRGVPTTDVPITYVERPDRSETNLNPIRDGGIILLELYRKAKTSNPLFYFGSIGLLSELAGVAVALYVGFEWFARGTSHEVLAIVAAAFVLLGVQLLMFGFLADLLLTLHEELIDRLQPDGTGEEWEN